MQATFVVPVLESRNSVCGTPSAASQPRGPSGRRSRASRARSSGNSRAIASADTRTGAGSGDVDSAAAIRHSAPQAAAGRFAAIAARA
jgi:hypothetical protein